MPYGIGLIKMVNTIKSSFYFLSKDIYKSAHMYIYLFNFIGCMWCLVKKFFVYKYDWSSCFIM